MVGDFSVFLILPLALGFMYSAAAMAFKRAMAEGLGIRRIVLYSNLATAILLVPLLSLAHKPQPGASFYQPLITGLVFFIGMVLNIAALQRGDVSVATPLLGTKVLFVAFFTIIVLGQPVLPSLWIAAICVCVALTLLRGPAGHGNRRFWSTVMLAAGSSAAFALCDVFFQLWTRVWGVGLFIPMVLGIVCLLSALLLLKDRPAVDMLTGSAKRWLIIGCTLNGLQTLGIVICIGLFRHPNAATAINIVYNSRGIWSVLLVWGLGHWYANVEKDQGRGVMIARLIGSILLLVAIILTLIGH
jgi:drug/metabolite transporter (DMT)-like permease